MLFCPDFAPHRGLDLGAAYDTLRVAFAVKSVSNLCFSLRKNKVHVRENQKDMVSNVQVTWTESPSGNGDETC